MNGPVSAADMDGRLRLETVNGPLSLTAVAGDVRARTENGPLSVRLTGPRWSGVGLGETLSHRAHHHVVRDQRAPVHVSLGLATERRSRGHRLPQHVAGGDLRDPPGSRQFSGLCALARPGGTEKRHTHVPNLSGQRRRPDGTWSA